MNKNNISKDIFTAGAIVGLGISTALGQNNKPKKIELYDPIPVLEQGEEYNFGGKEGSFYTLNTINKIVEQYDAGLINPDTVIGDIEMDFFRDLNTTGFAEYSTTKKDRRAMATLSQMLNNVDNGQEIGELTANESYLAFKALRNAGYLRNPGDRVKLLFPRTDQSSMARINGKKAIIPGQNVVRGAIFAYTGDKKKCNNCDEEETTDNARPYTTKSFSSELELSALYSKDMKFLPMAGFIAKYGKLGLGIEGAYTQNNKEDALVFANIQGNGSTTDITTTNKQLTSFGTKLVYDITDRIRIGISGQKNYLNQNQGGSVNTIVSDGVNQLNQIVEKDNVQNNSSYFTYGPDVRIGLSDKLGIVSGLRLRDNAVDGAYCGLSYRFGGNK